MVVLEAVELKVVLEVLELQVKEMQAVSQMNLMENRVEVAAVQVLKEEMLLQVLQVLQVVQEQHLQYLELQ
jgi:hypothetical protein